jgi:hypothetical protein
MQCWVVEAVVVPATPQDAAPPDADAAQGAVMLLTSCSGLPVGLTCPVRPLGVGFCLRLYGRAALPAACSADPIARQWGGLFESSHRRALPGGCGAWLDRGSRNLGDGRGRMRPQLSIATAWSRRSPPSTLNPPGDQLEARSSVGRSLEGVRMAMRHDVGSRSALEAPRAAW